LPAPPDTAWITQQWELARIKKGKAPAAVLVLDEAQKIAHWSVEVKRLWDEDKREGGLMHVEEYFYFGGYPAGYTLKDDELRFRQYIRDSLIETAISKDILLMNRVEKPVLLRQLFVLSCEYAAQILSYQKMLGQLQDAGNTVTLAHYQRLLEGAFLIRGLEKWSGSAIRSRSSSPKWPPLNTGLITGLANRTFAEWKNDPMAWGRLVEAAVGAHLVNGSSGENIEAYYWRDGNEEMDFVLRKGSGLTAIEVKSAGKIRKVSGLQKFKKCFPRAKTLIIGPGGMSFKEFFETDVLEIV